MAAPQCEDMRKGCELKHSSPPEIALPNEECKMHAKLRDAFHRGQLGIFNMIEFVIGTPLSDYSSATVGDIGDVLPLLFYHSCLAHF